MTHDEPILPGLRWWPLTNPAVNLGTSTVSRIVTDQPDPEFKPRPVGFTAQLEPPDQQGETEEGGVAQTPRLGVEDYDEHAAHQRPDGGVCPECGDVDGYHYRTCTRHNPSLQGETGRTP